MRAYTLALMKLDLEKFAVARGKHSRRNTNMAYLMQPIRRELEERTGLSGTSLESVLVFDFEEGCFEFPGIERVGYASLLDPDSFDPGSPDTTSEVSGPGLPGAPGDGESFDCVVNNLQGSWFEFEPGLDEVKRVLKPGGIFCFSAFGPDTLAEIYHAWKQVDDYPHVHPFIDMHHLGDMLLKTGFEKPIVDADWLQVEYADCAAVIADLRSEGFVNLDSGRRKTLTGPHRFKQFESRLANQTNSDGKITITFEIIYGYAQKPLFMDGQVRVSPPSAVI